MLFLVDYENVGNIGMKGCHYLNASDHVIVFYSDAKKNMERRFLENITKSGCVFEVCKLCNKGKNALDFYIASKLGELFGSGFEGTSVIVSCDSGYQAVQDYWGKRAERKRRVLLAASVEDGIVSSNENSERVKELKRLRENLTIGGFYVDYTEQLRLKTVIKKLFDGTEYEELTEQIQKLMESKERTPRIIYLNCLHIFGREDGLAIYNKMKACEEL
ncbi:MAG: PIN domain-containing protein [Butyrivibrio sp.]|nr:PIN domain-containing protein [Muribaculum sp.]MCM1551886.1 PIN domain-containing protein [Butyrivibrio sp.]